MLDVQCLLGLCAYFRRFVAGFSMLSKLLYDLLRKNVEISFGEREYCAFETLKSKLMEFPVLRVYDPRDETELHCDASKLGFGLVLLQRKKDVSFFSKRTTNIESRYYSFEHETLAIMYALRLFRIYLQGIHFKIVTDYNALKLTIDKLEKYDKVFEHRSGEKMKHVNAFCRAVSVMIIKDNTLESNLANRQNLDENMRQLRGKLQESEDQLYEMRNGLAYRKRNGDILFYIPRNMENNVIRKCHDEMGHFGLEKTIRDESFYLVVHKDKNCHRDLFKMCDVFTFHV